MHDNDFVVFFDSGQIMRGTLLLFSYLLAFVAATEKPNHDTKDHAPVTHEQDSREEDEEGSFDSGSGASGSGEGTELVKLEHVIRFSLPHLQFVCRLVLKALKAKI